MAPRSHPRCFPNSLPEHVLLPQLQKPAAPGKIIFIVLSDIPDSTECFHRTWHRHPSLVPSRKAVRKLLYHPVGCRDVVQNDGLYFTRISSGGHLVQSEHVKKSWDQPNGGFVFYRKHTVISFCFFKKKNAASFVRVQSQICNKHLTNLWDLTSLFV